MYFINTKSRLNKLWASLLLSGFSLISTATAYAWPTKPIRIIVPFSAGGTTDYLGRLVAEGLSNELGQPVIVENKAGAGGNIGATEVVRAKPDGYTLLLGTPGTQVINQLVYKNIPFDPQKDFSPVAFIASVPNVILANPSVGINSIEDLLNKAKTEPNTLNWGSPGIGSSGHLSLALLTQKTDAEIVHVPYKGASQANADLQGGQIELAADNLPTALGLINSGKLTALGVTSLTSSEAAPHIPPVAETIPGYELVSWFVLMAPADTPTPIVGQLNQAINKWLEKPTTKQKFQLSAATPEGGTPERLATHIKNEQQKYEELVRAAGIEPQ